MTWIFSEVALLPDGWAKNVRLSIDTQGRIDSLDMDAEPGPRDLVLKDRILLPAPANLHSHGFQRALAGLTETRGGTGQDSFWTWRRLMYAFLEHLTPDHTQAINAFAQMEMLEAGYASVAEFHYVHHQGGGVPYDDPAENSLRVVAAASDTGIGLTLLPVYYAQGGVDGRPLEGGQLRFKCDLDQYAEIWGNAQKGLRALPGDCFIGIAPHSLRAVSKADLEKLTRTHGSGPIHIHIAEQLAEIEEIEQAHGQRPVDWLLNNFSIDGNWCLVHATHLSESEKERLARSGAVTGLCPVTEANLGDGIFDAAGFMARSGRMGIGTDSNVAISLVHELRTMEYSQRLHHKKRAVFCAPDASTGRTLFDTACAGGAQANGRDSGALKVGLYADMMTLDAGSLDLMDLSGDTALDSWIFSSRDRLIADVWAAGRHLVKEGRHIRRERIARDYRQAITYLRKLL